MLGLGSSIVQSSRSHSEVITLYEQESFSTVGDWGFYSGVRQAYLGWTGFISSQTPLPLDQEFLIDMPAGALSETASNEASNSRLFFGFVPQTNVIKAGVSLYIRNVKITAERY